MDLSLPENLTDLSLDDQRGRFIDANAEVLGIGLYKRLHIIKASALREVLIDRDAWQESEALFIALRHDLGVS